MGVNLRGRSFLKLLDFTPAEIRYLLDLSRNFKDLKRTHTPHTLSGREEHCSSVREDIYQNALFVRGSGT